MDEVTSAIVTGNGVTEGDGKDEEDDETEKLWKDDGGETTGTEGGEER
jgi:hypothetical protein